MSSIEPIISPWLMTLCDISLWDSRSGSSEPGNMWWCWRARSVDDDAAAADDECLCQWLCVCCFTVMNIPLPDGWPSTRQSEQTPSTCMRHRRPDCLFNKVTVSGKGDRTEKEFNISTADSCNLIVTLWNRYFTFDREIDYGSILMAL